MAGVSGSQAITHHTNLLACLNGQLNNPDVSDLTLQVDNDTYHVHKLILASQSSVFQSMLTGHNWIESKEKLIKLDEHPDCVDAFSHFLKYLYSGEVTLNCDNVCSIHMLADKYDIVALKEAGLEFIRDVLDGVHGDLLKSSTKWLPYIEKYVPDLVEKCYEVIRTHFYALDRPDISLADLTVEQMKTILDPKFGNEIVVENEYNLFCRVLKWNEQKSGCSPIPMDSDILEEILPLIRFGNMEVKDLKSLLSKCSKSHIKDILFEASQCQHEVLQMSLLLNKNAEDLEPRNHTCLHDKSVDDHIHVCKHMNPRLYLSHPYGSSDVFDIEENMEFYGYEQPGTPIDTANLKSFVGRVTDNQPGDCEDGNDEYGDNKDKWFIVYGSKLEADKAGFETVREDFSVTSRGYNCGREFTLVIAVNYNATCTSRNTNGHCMNNMYVKKVKGQVPTTGAFTVNVESPRRVRGEWLTADSHQNHQNENDYEYKCTLAIYLH